MTTEILGEETISTEGLCDILRQLNPEADMMPQSLSERINKEEAITYLKEVFEASLRENLRPVRSEISSALLLPFSRVFPEDSTEATLNEKLAGSFRGSGGKASESALKADVIYEAKQDIPHKILISGGNVSDRSRAEDILGEVRENDLVLRDLGYFTLNSLKKIGERDAFFLSHLLSGVNVYLSENRDAPKISLPGHMGKRETSLSSRRRNGHMACKRKAALPPCGL
jgi:hypothetical protein